ncbi:MAG: ROK family protein [Oscillospiraceae bacterium]|nr:ROK family protein [Oscillospiraceae bacterium]
MKFSAAIDLGGTNIGIGIVSEEGELVFKTSVPVEDNKNPEALLTQMAEGTKQCIADSGREISDIEFVGIGIPGLIKGPKGPVILAANINWHNVDAVGFLEEKIGLPVILGNDADCAAMGEYHAGAGKQYQSLIMITLGTGIGGGAVIDGKLFPGCNGFGGEYGHVPLVHNGVQCGCGKKGCFEVYGSANALKRETREMAEEHPESLIWEMCEGDLDNIGGRTAFDAAEQGDETGKAIVEQYINYLADGISGIINVFRPEVIILGGGVSNQGASLLDPLNKKVAKLCVASDTIEAPKVLKASLGNSAGIIGAGLLGF